MYHTITPAEEEAIRRSGEEQAKQALGAVNRIIDEREQQYASQRVPSLDCRLTERDLEALNAGTAVQLGIFNPVGHGVIQFRVVPPTKPVPAPAASYLWGADVARELGAEA